MCTEKKKKKINIQYGSPGRVQLPPGMGLAAVAQGLDDLYNLHQWASRPILLKHLLQDVPGDMVKSLLQVHKTHADCLGKPPLKLPQEGKYQEDK